MYNIFVIELLDEVLEDIMIVKLKLNLLKKD